MRKKILITLFILVLLLFSSAMTYSIFNSGATLTSNNQKIASFIFGAEKTDHLQLSLVDLAPGSVENYKFQVTNNLNDKISDVTIKYQIIVKTLHIMPLVIDLYKVEGEQSDLIMSCNENNPNIRNDNNELVCTSKEEQMVFNYEENDNYELRVSFPAEYNGVEYTGLVDYVDVEINSWQKLGN